MAITVYQSVTAILFVCLIWAAVLFYKNPSWALAMLLPLLAWMIFDPLVLALGNKLGEGSMLYILTWLRYLLRVLALPFLLVVAFDQLRRARVGWATDPLANLGVWAGAFLLVGIGFARTYWGGLGLEVTELEGIKQYREVESLGFPFAAVITLLLLTVFGGTIFKATRVPWLLLGALLWLVAVALSAGILPPVAIALASAVFVVGVLLTEHSIQKISPNPRQ